MLPDAETCMSDVGAVVVHELHVLQPLVLGSRESIIGLSNVFLVTCSAIYGG